MLNFYVVDDDPVAIRLVTELLRGAGHEVTSSTSSAAALREIADLRPDCVLLDLMMPGLDGYEMCRRLREIDTLRLTRIVVVSAKSYDFDRRRARALGADGYLTKPIDPRTFLGRVEAIVANHLTVRFWGVRGTLPVPGRRALRYGGNTCCVSVRPEDGPLLIFDAGSGIKELSNHIASSRETRLTAKIFITHPHWDHIAGLPFFAPLYAAGNEFEICGPRQGDLGIGQSVGGQMDSVHFPITMREFAAHVLFRDLGEERVEVDGLQIDTMLLKHPGNCLGYRVRYREASVAYVTDNELFPEDTDGHDPHYLERLTEFVRDTDILIADATYTESGYRKHVGWGHSAAADVAELAHRAGVRALFLFHHDPDQTDDDIDVKLREAQARLTELGSGTLCHAPTEGETVRI